jgi:tyrosyl-tRNA synthetase
MTLTVDDVEQRAALIERGLAEFLTHEELVNLLATGAELRHYIGFEISGMIHLGTGLMSMRKVRDFTAAGVSCTVFLADWHTWINDKLGGDREVIHRVATGYFTEGFKASMKCVGGDPSALRFVLGSDLYAHDADYWATVIDVSKNTTLARMQRSISILGRAEGEQVDFAKLIYPAMQAADIFALGVHIAHAGMDQRKAHVVARDVATHIRSNPLRDADGRPLKPLAAHHPLLLGLKKPPTWPIPEGRERDAYASMKMSKSDPSSAVFVHDSPDEVRRKVMKAFCPPGEVEFNPVLNWLEHLVFGMSDEPLRIDRSEANGGPVTFAAYHELREAYVSGALHPMDAKAALTDHLVDLLAPAREHFAQPEVRAMLTELESVLGR